MKTAAIRIDEGRNEVYAGKREVRLPKKEYEILLLLKNLNVTLSRETIIDEVWGADKPPKDTRTVDQHVARLRRRLSVRVIETIPGYGYKFVGV